MTFDRLAARARALPPLAADLLVAAVVGVFTAADAAVNDPGYRQADALTWALLVVSLAALACRRRWPVPVACVTGAACAGWALYGHIGELLNLPVIVALYTVAVLGDRRRTLWTAVVASLASGAVALVVGRDVVNPQGLPVLEMVWPLVPLLLGEVVRTRRELLAEYAARAVRAEEDREREAARRVREERARVAREVHDILAHTVSAMTVQAGVALDALDTAPEVSRRAMTQVRSSGKEAVRELRATLSVLREAESTAPAPRLDQLDELVAGVEAGGVRVSLRRDTGGAGVPAVVEAIAYRIVQEALTNVVRHSAATHAAVSVTRTGPRLSVEVVDDGPPVPPPPDPPGAGAADQGFGLIGMRERAVSVGGSVTYGPDPGGGFRVHAELPAELPPELPAELPAEGGTP
ncbi:histidine kinase [Streptomyces sp. C11-1]|uniref:histidine kinase n=1 Tax=Streptomyces durocortorensis TaxID=2811104 RepID=A0ABY9W511_9ACTN|nr:histidine kinase [Streptomyces durocortorensis]WNF31209.1 histidine kinase [Streptomyces durocortorensis]